MPSFDVVSKVDMQEVKNAVDQVQREIGTRYDFRGSKSSVTLEESTIVLIADDKMKLEAMQELLRQKLAKRGVSVKQVEFGEAVPAASDTLRQVVTVKQGLKDEELKKITKSIKSQKAKVNSQIQADQIRVSGKKRDDLQAVIAFLRSTHPELELQFVNFRE